MFSLKSRFTPGEVIPPNCGTILPVRDRDRNMARKQFIVNAKEMIPPYDTKVSYSAAGP
jgi:hypothetical protein